MYRPGSQGIIHYLGFEIFANIEKFKSHIFKGEPSPSRFITGCIASCILEKATNNHHNPQTFATCSKCLITMKYPVVRPNNLVAWCFYES